MDGAERGKLEERRERWRKRSEAAFEPMAGKELADDPQGRPADEQPGCRPKCLKPGQRVPKRNGNAPVPSSHPAVQPSSRLDLNWRGTLRIIFPGVIRRWSST